MTTNSQNSDATVYDYLDAIRARPLMYVHQKDNLDELELLVFGYYAALNQHNIDENAPSINLHFLDWLRHHKNWSTNQGWAKAIQSNLSENLSAFDAFFTLIDEYRQLEPKRLAQITIDPARHSVNIKMNRVLPSQIVMVQYEPEHLYFLESVFVSKSKSQSHLVDKLEEIMELAYKEFKAEANEWIWL